MKIEGIDWERIVLAMPEPVALVDAGNRFVRVNAAMEAFLGRPGVRIIGQTCHSLMHGADAPVTGCPFACMLASRRRESSELEDPRTNRWLSVTVDPILDPGGSVVGAVHRLADITAAKEAERAAVRQSRIHEQLAVRMVSLMNNVPGVVYRGLRDWSVDFVGAGIERITGYTPEEFVRGSARWRELIDPEDIERVRQAFREAVRGRRKVLRVEYRALHKDGGFRWIADRRQMIYDAAGEFVCVDGLLLDITERKRMEEALRESEEKLRQSQKMEAVGRLAGGIAHDFNNLITAIRGYSDLLLERLGADSPLRRDLEEIRKAGDRAASLTRQLLAFSRKQVLHPRVLDLDDVVAALDGMLRRLIGEDVDLVTVLKRGSWNVRVDPGQVEQVILNLVVNARDAMPAGGKVTIETGNVVLGDSYASRHAVVAPGEYVMVAISDTGTGMDEETKSRLFEPFFTTKEKGKGTGLGLSTVYGIVKQSGGYVWVYSEPGEGTTFKVYFPRYQGTPDAPVEEEAAGPSAGGKETVLLVEDEEAVRALIRKILEANGYAVLAASNGEEALEIAGRHPGPIHLILTDVIMPKMGGRETVESLVPRIPAVKVLFISGYTDEAIVHHGVLEAGIPFLEKPFTPEALLRKVRSVLDGRGTGRGGRG